MGLINAAAARILTLVCLLWCKRLTGQRTHTHCQWINWYYTGNGQRENPWSSWRLDSQWGHWLGVPAYNPSSAPPRGNLVRLSRVWQWCTTVGVDPVKNDRNLILAFCKTASLVFPPGAVWRVGFIVWWREVVPQDRWDEVEQQQQPESGDTSQTQVDSLKTMELSHAWWCWRGCSDHDSRKPWQQNTNSSHVVPGMYWWSVVV